MQRSEVPGAFDRVAAAYDELVGRNPGYDRHLRESATWLRGSRRVLDLGCGTGRSTRALAEMLPESELVGLDASEGMLSVARRAGIRATFHLGDGHTPPPGLGDFDGIFAAYLLRNLARPDLALRQWRAQLPPGGALVVHDYVLDGSRRAQLRWHAVALGVVVPLGVLRTRELRLWRYLHRSVLTFDRRDALVRRIERAGFRVEEVATASGWQRGIVHRIRAVA